MLPQNYRLKSDKDFKKVFKFSRPLSFGHFSLRSTENKRLTGTSRYGIVVSNKIDKRATRRNGLRRRIRAVLQEELLQLKAGYDVIIFVRTGFPEPFNYSDIKKEMIEILRKANLFR